jgi:DNA polymerase III subunit delta
MGVLREPDLADFLKRKAAKFNGLLLFGNDDGAISAAARQVIASFSGGEEPLKLDASAIVSDPGLLSDAFLSMSLLGDRRLIIVNGVSDNHVSHVQSVVNSQALGNFVLFIAESLKKGSKLRDIIEASTLMTSISFYAEGEAALIVRTQTLMRERGATFEEGAAERFVELLGSDRSVLMGEVEKLSLFVHPATSISISDVENICGDQASFEADNVISSLMEGNLDETDRIYTSMLLSGDNKSVLIMVQMYLSRLENVSAAVARGADAMSACRSAKPPFFDKQQQAVLRYIRFLSGDDLGRMQTSVQQAILQSRQNADLGDAITGRCLLSLARMTRQLRARAAA